MKSFNITLPEDLLGYVRNRAKEGGFGTPTEFMRHLIRNDREEQVEKSIEKRLLAGLKSGLSREPSEAFFTRMRVMIDEVADKRRKSRRGEKAPHSSARR